MEFILIRHTSVDVPPGVCYGQTDVPLRPTFADEAHATLSALRQRLSDGIMPDRVFTSPLSRCTRLAAYCGYPDAHRDPRLKEISFGQWEMVPFDENHDPRLQEWYADYLHVAAPEGESFVMLHRRVCDFLDEVACEPYRRVLVFAHGGVLMSAQIRAGICSADDAFSHLTPYGGVISVEI